MEKNETGKSSRRNFIRNVSLGVGAVSVAGVAKVTLSDGNEAKAKSGKIVRLLSPDGKLAAAPSTHQPGTFSEA